MSDFLLDRPATVNQSSVALDNSILHEVAVFGQDDWRVKLRLTFNLGLRWDPYLPFRDGQDTLAYVKVGSQSTVFPSAPPGMLFGRGDPVLNTIASASLAKFAPRFGFAFDPEGKGRMSIRGGYGIFFSNPRAQDVGANTRAAIHDCDQHECASGRHG